MLEKLTIRELNKKISSKDIKVSEIAKFYLDKVRKYQERFKPFIDIYEDQVMQDAQEKDKNLLSFKKLPILYGIPFALKDNILVGGRIATAGSKILENFIAPYDATVVSKIKEQEGILMGKTNLDEFAMGSSTENSGFFTTRNPYDNELVPGGSSGGSAASCALDMVNFSLGSDTGGSIRQPASFCGVYGLKPTYGSVSRFGLIALSSSLDVIGPFSTKLDDIFLIFDIIKGTDKFDLTSYYPNEIKTGIRDLRVAYIKEYFEGCDINIKNKILDIFKVLEKQKIEVREISMPILEYALPCYYIIMSSEASSNLARYDGIRYGSSISDLSKLRDLYLKTKTKFFGEEPKRRIFMGTFSLSYGYYDAYYLQALKFQKKIKYEFLKIFKDFDLILGPTAPELPFKIGAKSQDPVKMYLSDIYTVTANLGGFPALSIPAGFIKNLPFGLQVMANLWEEPTIYRFAKLIEQIL